MKKILEKNQLIKLREIIDCSIDSFKEQFHLSKKLFELAKEANKYVKGSVDEVIAFNHNYGCSQTGDDQEHTRTILADLINHPNAGGVLVLGLGCENSNIDVLKPYIGAVDESRIKFLVCQKSDDEMEGFAPIRTVGVRLALTGAVTTVSVPAAVGFDTVMVVAVVASPRLVGEHVAFVQDALTSL